MNKKGVAFLTTIILLGVMVIVSAALSFMLLKDAFTVKRLKYSTQAYYLAEAGVEEAIEDLWDNNFNTSGFPKTRTLGAGTINVTLDTSKWGGESVLLITSTGTARGISRTIKTEVKANVSPSLNYAILANGRIWISGNSAVNGGTGDGVHSNSNARRRPRWPWWWSRAAVEVGGIVDGDASAVGEVYVRPGGTVTGTQTSYTSSVDLPSLDAAFFNYYYNLAYQSGDVYNGTQFFSSDLSPGNGVIYVNGNVYIAGNVTLNGCIVSTGSIWIWPLGTFTQNQVGNLPALMTRGGGIFIWNPATINGLIYSHRYVDLLSYGAANLQVNGSIIARKNVYASFRTQIDFVKQNPPGLGATPPGWIINWNE